MYSSNLPSAVGRRLVFIIVVLDFLFVNAAKTRHPGSQTPSKTLNGVGDKVLDDDADMESSMRDSTVERIEAEPFLDSRDLHSLDLGLVFSGRSGSRAIVGRIPPGNTRIVQQPNFFDVSTVPRRKIYRSLLCRRPTASSSSSTSSSSSYSSEPQLSLKNNWILQRSNFLRANQLQVPLTKSHLRSNQLEICSSNSANSISSRQEADDVTNDQMAARQIAMTRWLSLWPLPILNRDASRSDDDLLLTGLRQQLMTFGPSNVKDGIEYPRKKNCETKYKKDCLIRRVVPRKTSTVDPMLMMVGIGRK